MKEIAHIQFHDTGPAPSYVRNCDLQRGPGKRRGISFGCCSPPDIAPDADLNSSVNQNLKSPFMDQLDAGFRWLVFDDFVEEEFRHYYAQSTVSRARLFPIIGIAAILISLGFMFSSAVHPVAIVFL